MPGAGGSLFDVDVPSGFRYRDDFLAADEEAELVEAVGRIEFSTFEMRGVVARRRVAFFGRSYDAANVRSRELPPFLLILREKVAGWANVTPDAFAMTLVNEYPPGAPIGWHRDAPQYDIVAGISLLAPARMRFRPYVLPKARSSAEASRRRATHEIILQRRSAYLMAGESRNGYEHHIPAVTSLRYSITFRTLRS
jgi:alkylated DNA repair dioxygenase AlkB